MYASIGELYAQWFNSPEAYLWGDYDYDYDYSWYDDYYWAGSRSSVRPQSVKISHNTHDFFSSPSSASFVPSIDHRRRLK